MANMLYNGVELPDINEVWTDKTTYPYAFSYATSNGYRLLVLSTTVIYANTSSQIVVPAGSVEYQLVDGAWAYSRSFSSASNFKRSSLISCWSSYDIAFKPASNGVWLEGSEPVDPNAPAEPEAPHITTSSGDGFALYNGVKLSNIDSVWTDKEAHPYATMVSADGSDVGLPGATVGALVLTSARGTAASGGLELNPPCHRKVYTYTDSQALVDMFIGAGISAVVGEWFATEEYELTSTSLEALPNWSNYDILNTDGSVYLAASDPIPLDGMTVIEWDGDTTGLSTGVSDPFYFNVSSFFSANNPSCVVINNNDILTTIPDLVSDGAPYAVWRVADRTYRYVYATDSGVYFLNSGDMYTSLFAYHSVESPPDDGGGGGTEPTYDRTAFLSGMAMGLTGKGYPTGANGHMSYNGIELADINSIWTDKSNHVFICKAVNSYFAIVSTVAPYQDSVNGGVSLSAPFYFRQYGCFTDEAAANEYGTTAYTWTFYQEHSLDEGVSNFDQTVIWTSTDIRKDSDGSVFLAASEPIPASGIGGNDDFTKGYLVGAELRRKRVIAKWETVYERNYPATDKEALTGGKVYNGYGENGSPTVKNMLFVGGDTVRLTVDGVSTIHTADGGASVARIGNAWLGAYTTDTDLTDNGFDFYVDHVKIPAILGGNPTYHLDFFARNSGTYSVKIEKLVT